jgi:hypothetical protein
VTYKLFRKKPVVIQATQWFKNGDHPEDGDIKNEGNIVRYYRHSTVNGTAICNQCANRFSDHGWVDTLEGGHIVCVGDWIITGVKGEHYPCKPEIFEMTYERVV